MMCIQQMPAVFNEIDIDNLDYTEWDYHRPPKRKCSNYVKRNGYKHFDEDDDVKAKMPVVPRSVAHCPSEVESLENPTVS